MSKKLKMVLMAGALSLTTMSMTACNTDTTQEEKKDTSQVEVQTEDKKQEDKKQKEITYYTYDINSEEITPHIEKVEEISVGNIVKAMIEKNVLPNDTKVKTAKVEEVDGVRTLVVDMNSSFVNFDQGSSAELLMLQCFTNSLIKTFKVEQVALTVEGAPYSSGHIAFDKGEFLKFK